MALRTAEELIPANFKLERTLDHIRSRRVDIAMILLLDRVMTQPMELAMRVALVVAALQGNEDKEPLQNFLNKLESKREEAQEKRRVLNEASAKNQRKVRKIQEKARKDELARIQREEDKKERDRQRAIMLRGSV